MKRVTYAQYKEDQEKKANNNKFADIKVNLSVNKDNPEVTSQLRLVGFPVAFYEYNARKYREVKDPATGKTKREPYDHVFPDASTNKKITRVGLDDKAICPWAKMGFQGSKRYAINCLEKQKDGTWVPKVLNRGSSIFDEFFTWEEGRREEDADLSNCLGGKSAPLVRIKAKFDPSKLGNVAYKVMFNQSDVEIDDDMIELLRQVGEPSAEKLKALKKEYLADRKEDPTLPEWEDFFTFGYDLESMFKFDEPQEISSEDDEEEEEEEEEEVKFEEPVKSSKAKTASKETSKDDEDSEDDEELANIKW